jgi:hypothetical protein
LFDSEVSGGNANQLPAIGKLLHIQLRLDFRLLIGKADSVACLFDDERSGVCCGGGIAASLLQKFVEFAAFKHHSAGIASEDGVELISGNEALPQCGVILIVGGGLALNRDWEKSGEAAN